MSTTDHTAVNYSGDLDDLTEDQRRERYYAMATSVARAVSVRPMHGGSPLPPTDPHELARLVRLWEDARDAYLGPL